MSALLLTWLLNLLKPSLSMARPNILFIVADDLRPDLNCYYQGDDQPTPTHPTIHSPNIDSLAARSILFKRAYVQFALCAPSRTSFLTGRRPDSTETYGFHFYWRTEVGNFTTLPQYFKENRYLTFGYGKIFHPDDSSGGNDPLSWSEKYYSEEYFKYYKNVNRINAWEAIPRATMTVPLPDEDIADHAVEALRRISPKARTGEQPFFMAVGFVKPHRPFYYPEEFESYYNVSETPLPVNGQTPINMPELAWSSYGGLLQYDNMAGLNLDIAMDSRLPGQVIRSLRAGYYRSASFTDAMVGRVLDELADLGLEESTIVTFIGDHGFHLGEHNIWLKNTNFEIALRTPMIIRVPGVTDHGPNTKRLVEFVDLFPTLVDLTGLQPIPLCRPDNHLQLLCTEGASLLHLILNPQAKFKGSAFSQVQRVSHKGYTVRTDDYRYTEWLPDGSDWEDVEIAELYDHVSDPDESWNRADDPNYHDVRVNLSQVLRKGWRAVIGEALQAASQARQNWAY